MSGFPSMPFLGGVTPSPDLLWQVCFFTFGGSCFCMLSQGAAKKLVAPSSIDEVTNCGEGRLCKQNKLLRMKLLMRSTCACVKPNSQQIGGGKHSCLEAIAAADSPTDFVVWCVALHPVTCREGTSLVRCCGWPPKSVDQDHPPPSLQDEESGGQDPLQDPQPGGQPPQEAGQVVGGARHHLSAQFDTQRMVTRARGGLDRGQQDAMLTWSHYRFRQRLLNKVREYPWCNVVICDEHYTSKCGRCGTLNHQLGRKKTFLCRACTYIADRDVNATRNIMLRFFSLLHGLCIGTYPTSTSITWWMQNLCRLDQDC